MCMLANLIVGAMAIPTLKCMVRPTRAIYGLNQEVALVSCARAYRNPWLYALMPTSPKIRSIVAIKVLRFNYYILLLLRVRGFEPSTITSELFPRIDTCHNTESEGLTFIMHHIED